MNWSSLADAVWQKETMGARTVRWTLAPMAWAFGVVVRRRNARYDRGVRAPAALPALSVGNLTVGGTGKTPFSAWCVQRLRRRGAHPSIVMRGVGDDEWRVHAVLNPGVSVIVSPDRGVGMVTARTRGADCVVLDDAFQHRRAARVADVVLLSADQWTGAARLLPAGPFREPLGSLSRAQVVVITVKAASSWQVDAVMAAARAAAPHVPLAVVRLVPGPLRLAVALATAGSQVAAESRSDSHPALAGAHRPGPRRDLLTHPPEWLAQREMCAVSAIGDPAAFEAQLRSLGAILRTVRRFPDHHDYDARDAAQIAAAAVGSFGVVCTLKDAVKLASCWPRAAPPLWYLSQSMVVDQGIEALDRILDRLLAARVATTLTAG